MSALAPFSLDALLRPRAVAVIGASRRRGTIGGELFHNLMSKGFSGAVYPVNPGSPVVQSVRAYASVEDIPDTVDLAVLVVPAQEVLAQVEACGRKGVRGLCVITAGFGELGLAGRAVQDQIVARVRHYGMRMVGPNCLGLLNCDPDMRLDATFSPAWPPHGGVSISSQSGALGQAILEYARDLGIGVRHFVSIGNKADVSGNDLLEYWEADPGTKVILLYLESFGNPRKFLQIARRVARTKPILVVKSGRTAAGAKAASSHTGALAGRDVAVDALLRQAGVVRADTIEELFDLAMLLANQPTPRGRRVAILTNAGGPGIMASDACESQNLRVATLSADTQAALREFLPSEASVRNPVDMIASATPAAYEQAVRILLADAEVDALIVVFVPPIVTEAMDVATSIRQAAAGADKPVLTCFMGKHGIPEALSSLREGRLPSYAFPEAVAIALGRAAHLGERLARPQGKTLPLDDATREAAQAILARSEGSRWLATQDVRDLLATIGIATPAQAVAVDAAAAQAAAVAIGFPVAVKLVSQHLTHKSEVGGVVLGLTTPESVGAAVQTMRQKLQALGQEAEMQGVLVQAMAPAGVECFIGATRDAAFGPLIGFGLGGVNVELWQDVVFRLAPLTEQDAKDMLAGVRGKKLFDGFRGAPAADRAALEDAVLRIGRLMDACPQIQEIDLNPLMALEPGRGVVAVDARMRL